MTNARDTAAKHERDDEAALQEELRRESEEHARLGDIERDRNLSGSSTWVTLPAQADTQDCAAATS